MENHLRTIQNSHFLFPHILEPVDYMCVIHKKHLRLALELLKRYTYIHRQKSNIEISISENVKLKKEMGIKDYMSQKSQENDYKATEIHKRKCQHD